jgi:MOB kinase activator 1
MLKPKSKTFVAHKVRGRLKKYEQPERTEDTLQAGDLKAAVRLPEGNDINDWLAYNLIQFVNTITCLWGPLAKYCTVQTCPKMTAGPAFEFLWQDSESFKKPTALPAAEYIANVLAWTAGYINNTSYFPEDQDQPFPKEFRQIIANIFKRLFRVYAHWYHHHQADVRAEDLARHLNTAFRHFYLFAKEFKLIPEEQTAPLATIIRGLD